MIPAPIPTNEEQRLLDLRLYHILDSEAERDFDDLAILAAQVCDCSRAAITFIDKDRQWFKARKNIDLHEILRPDSFCGHTILQKDVLVVMDPPGDNRFFDNPNVTGGLNIRFYAGAPIMSPTGYYLGTVCVMDNKSKQSLPGKKTEALQAIARQVGRLLDLRLKDRFLAEKTVALVAAEKKLAQFNLQRREDENIFIATELHENFAQILAAVKMQLEFVGQENHNGNGEHIDTSKKLIKELMHEMKILSKAITPTTFENANYSDLIEAHTIQYSIDNKLKVEYKYENPEIQLTGAPGLSLFRIIELYLKMSRHIDAQQVSINLRATKDISLTFFDDGNVSPENENERRLYLQNIQTRVDILKGRMKQLQSEGEGSILKVWIPM